MTSFLSRGIDNGDTPILIRRPDITAYNRLIVLSGFLKFLNIVNVVQRVRHGENLNGSLILFLPYLVSCLVKTLQKAVIYNKIFASVRQ